MLNVNDRELVVPGQLIGEDIRYDMNCFREGTKVFSSVQGMARVSNNDVKVIPSGGSYTPKEGDLVIGVVEDALNNSRWLVDINSPYKCTIESERPSGNMSRRDSSPHFNIGDIITAKVSRVDEINSSNLLRPWKVTGGLIIDVSPKRVPRVVGKKRSMINMIMEKTGCTVIVGQNGKVWIKGDKTDVVVSVIKKIENEAQQQGLTDRIADMLNKKSESKS